MNARPGSIDPATKFLTFCCIFESLYLKTAVVRIRPTKMSVKFSIRILFIHDFQI